MSYPAGMAVRTVTFGAAVVMEDGAPLLMQVTIKASKSRVWRPTGSPVVSVSKTFGGADADGQYSLELPVTNQVGWGDGAGNVIDVSGGVHSHTYSATIKYTTETGVSVGTATTAAFVIPAGSGSIDLDDLLPVTSPVGVTVAVPDLWTLQVTAAQAAAAAAQAAAEAAAISADPVTPVYVLEVGETEPPPETEDKTIIYRRLM